MHSWSTTGDQTRKKLLNRMQDAPFELKEQQEIKKLKIKQKHINYDDDMLQKEWSFVNFSKPGNVGKVEPVSFNTF